jgi:hypothetical protein
MADVTIRVSPGDPLYLVGLHRPGQEDAEVLTGAERGAAVKNLPDGIYHISVTATGVESGTEVSVTFATATRTKTRTRIVGDSRRVTSFYPFELRDGDVHRGTPA